MDCTQVECSIGWHEWWLTLERVKRNSAAKYVRHEITTHPNVTQYSDDVITLLGNHCNVLNMK